MNPMLANKIEKKYYQLLSIASSAVSQITGKITANGIKLNQLRSNSINLYLVEAPNELGMLLRKIKGYELHTFSNDDFLLLINYLIGKGAIVTEIEFLGQNYFDEDLNEYLDEIISLNKNPELLKTIREHSLKISKFVAKIDKKIIFYRSGLIYSDEKLDNLGILLQPFFRGN